MAKITILGDFPGKNAGEDAELGKLLGMLSARQPGSAFLVPTADPARLQQVHGSLPIQPLKVRTASWLGASSLRPLLESDLVLVTGPLHLGADDGSDATPLLEDVVPLCERAGIPLVFFNARLEGAPAPHAVSTLRRALAAGPFAVFRDAGSIEMLERQGLSSGCVKQGMPLALEASVTLPADAVRSLARLGLAESRRALLGFEVGGYLERWQQASGNLLSRPEFAALVAGAMDAVGRTLDAEWICFVLDGADRELAGEVIGRMCHGDQVRLVAHPDYDFREIQGAMANLDLLVSVRTEALVLAGAVGTPMLDLGIHRSARALLSALGLQHWSIDFQQATAPRVIEQVLAAWDARERTHEALVPAVAQARVSMRESVARLTSLLERTMSRASVARSPATADTRMPIEIGDDFSHESPTQWQTELLEFTHDAIIIWEMDGAGIQYWNSAAERLYGYRREDVRGKTTHQLLRTRPVGSGIEELESKLARHGVWVGELQHVASDGRLILVESRLALLSQQHGRWLVLEVNRDITDRKHAELAQQEFERQLAHLRSRV